LAFVVVRRDEPEEQEVVDFDTGLRGGDLDLQVSESSDVGQDRPEHLVENVDVVIVRNVGGEEGETTPPRFNACNAKRSLGIAQMSIDLAKDFVLLPGEGGNRVDRD